MSLLSRFLARPRVVDWLIRRAVRTPYNHITSADGSELYMLRFWLFNPYTEEGRLRRWGLGLPSIRLHCIMRKDHDRDCHDHPWNARTFILRGWYTETRLAATGRARSWFRDAGDTASLRYGEFHRITDVSPGGVWTLFITWRYRGTWGFLVDGVKVPWRRYLNLE